MDNLKYQAAPDQAQEMQLISRIMKLDPEETLVLESAVNLEPLLLDLKRRRFKGLSWSSQSEGTGLKFAVQNVDPGDCCGCCGGN